MQTRTTQVAPDLFTQPIIPISLDLSVCLPETGVLGIYQLNGSESENAIQKKGPSSNDFDERECRQVAQQHDDVEHNRNRKVFRNTDEPEKVGNVAWSC